MPNCNCSVTCTSGASAYMSMVSKAKESKRKSIFDKWIKEGITFAIKRKEANTTQKEIEKKDIKFL